MAEGTWIPGSNFMIIHLIAVEIFSAISYFNNKQLCHNWYNGIWVCLTLEKHRFLFNITLKPWHFHFTLKYSFKKKYFYTFWNFLSLCWSRTQLEHKLMGTRFILFNYFIDNICHPIRSSYWTWGQKFPKNWFGKSLIVLPN